VRLNGTPASIVVHDLTTGARKVLLNGGTDGRVLPTGHLVYTSATTLFAVPFDETRLMVTGGPVPVQQGIRRTASGMSHAAWSASGTFVMVQRNEGGDFLRRVVWVSRQGQQEPTKLSLRNYGVPSSEMRVSPDGTRVAATIYSDDALRLEGLGTEVWVGDLVRGTEIRLSRTGRATSPVWTIDGQRVCYDSAAEVFCQAADGRSAAEASFKVDGLVNTRGFSHDGTRMVLETQGPKTGSDIAMATLGPPVETRPLLNMPYNETAPAISPDGRWLAYQSDESGRAEVYVRPFPAVDQALSPISIGGGSEPRWARDGSELFFTVRGDWTAPGVLMSVAVKPGSTFNAGPPTAVWKIPAGASLAYDVARNGRFLFHITQSFVSEDAPRPAIIVVQNWFEELKARVPTGAAQ
jgi:eukaryotic-like serine/threonine-protein kinase